MAQMISRMKRWSSTTTMESGWRASLFSLRRGFEGSDSLRCVARLCGLLGVIRFPPLSERSPISCIEFTTICRYRLQPVRCSKRRVEGLPDFEDDCAYSSITLVLESLTCAGFVRDGVDAVLHLR